MGGVQPSKLAESSTVTGLSYLEDGQFAKIYKGHMAATKESVTIKVPRVPDFIRKEKKEVKTHIEEAKRLLSTNFRKPRGEHLVRYLGASYDDFRKEIWVIREHVDGTDLETLMKNPSLCPSLRSPEERMRMAVGIAKGIASLHNMRSPMVHGDFKPSDVLVTARAKVPKITNFGLWDFKKFFIENTMAEDVVFLNPHQAPEVLIGQERPTLCSDVWSLAAVVLQWVTERPPWDLQELCSRHQYRGDRQASALHDAMDDQEEPTMSRDLEEASLVFLKSCFDYNPTGRPKSSYIMDELVSASQLPTWTNIAYHKYYADGNTNGKRISNGYIMQN
jgi:serine/threonine protein kinase